MVSSVGGRPKSWAIGGASPTSVGRTEGAAIVCGSAVTPNVIAWDRLATVPPIGICVRAPG